MSNFSGNVKCFYQCKPVKAACSSNVSKQNAFNESSSSKLVKPLTVSKPVRLTVVSTSNICNMSIISQHVKLLNDSKSMSSCNVCNQNAHIVNSISHHTKPLNVGKSDCSHNVNKPVICESVVVKLSKCACKRSFNVSSHKHGVAKPLNERNILMTSIYFYEMVLLFFIFHHNFCNSTVDNFFKGSVMHNNFSRNKFLNYNSFICHSISIFNISLTNVLSSSDRFLFL